jgi:dihydrofolate reductase
MSTPALPPVHLIVACARGGVIGHEGRMPWHLPEDLAHFRRTTLGHPVLMGRRTWDSLGRPLPGRRNIVLTRQPQWQAAGAERAQGLEQALALCAGHTGQVFIIGGAELYAQALRGPVACLHLTRIDADFPGDTHFPALDPAAWSESAREHLAPAAGRPFPVDFLQLVPVDPAQPTTP